MTPSTRHHPTLSARTTRRAAASRERSPGVPLALLPLALLGALVVVLPVAGLTLRVPWSDFWQLVTADDSLTALRLSLGTALVSACVCVLLGVPLGMVLARSEARLLRPIRAFVLLPVVLPPVVGGLALLATFGRRGILAAPMEATGIDIAFTTTAVVCAQVFVSLPFVVMGVEAAMRTHGTDFETAAAVLGASPGRTFAAVTLPLLLPAIASSAVLSFARSLGEFGATLTFAGSLAGTTRTLPLEIYLRRETDPDAAVAVSMLLVAIALVVVIAVYSLPRSGAPGTRTAPDAPTVGALRGRPGPSQRPGRATGSTDGRRWTSSEPAARPPVDTPPTDPTATTEAPSPHPAEAPSPHITPAPHITGLTTAALPDTRHSSPPRLTVAFDAPDRGISQSFTVEPGETLALTGPNGIGKSTALAVIAGLLVPPHAHVEVDDRTLTWTGRDRKDIPPHRRGVTLLLQDSRLFPHMSAVGNIVFGLRTAGITGGRAKERAQRMLDDLGIGHLSKARSRNLSGGQRARVALARALATDPQVVLLDEPSAALDAESAPAIRELLAALLADRTCVLVSHDPTEVEALAQRALRLDHG